ncbi:PIN domain-containing protein [Nocardia sp. NPDC051832]|uniref:PIN domain-containing protein n=1 Tax=Nocardia sp. NPDC051832 TaxID=3155673 RepID=UPI00341868E8
MQRVFLDTCVLYPAHLRDTILRFAEADLIQPLWTAEVLAELRRNLCARHQGDESAVLKVDRLIGILTGFFRMRWSTVTKCWSTGWRTIRRTGTCLPVRCRVTRMYC